MSAGQTENFSAELEGQLRESLRRCSPETIEGAIAYRRDGDAERVPAVVLGIIERFVEPEFRSRLKETWGEVRIVDDLGVDSLLMLEIVMLVEETLDVSIQNDELLELRTLDDVKTLIQCKIQGVPMPQRPRHMAIDQIAAVVPYQHPFLFLQEAVIREESAEGRYEIKGDERFLEGHFRDNPVFPASLMIEALGQLAVLFLISSEITEQKGPVNSNSILFVSCNGVRCHRVCRPGDVLAMDVKLLRVRRPLAVFKGAISVEGEKVAIIEDLSLSFSYEE